MTINDPQLKFDLVLSSPCNCRKLSRIKSLQLSKLSTILVKTHSPRKPLFVAAKKEKISSESWENTKFTAISGEGEASNAKRKASLSGNGKRLLSATAMILLNAAIRCSVPKQCGNKDVPHQGLRCAYHNFHKVWHPGINTLTPSTTDS